ncbi:hypothetical protein KPH14_001543 [Odynerus spinipes]|uniref:Uncharacterized protein n=1 Tax=Odynerus spinipes TaxID=1348599 RepID=A0AAD9VU85_9HYME|nr:hypothetical protein KPH14_001543 [Odynerus spinipes]
MAYWKEKKRDWDMLLDDWETKNLSLEPWMSTSIGNEDASLSYISKTEDESIDLPESKVENNDEKRDEDIVSPATPVTPVLDEETTNEDKKAKINDENAGTSDISPWEENNDHEKSSQETNSLMSTWDQNYTANTSPRERYRARSIVREAIDPQSDPKILRRRMRSSRMAVGPSTGHTVKQDDEDTGVQRVEQRKFANTARERRRESQQFSFDLK